MAPWECAIDDCDMIFDEIESAIIHQTNDHDRGECRICGTEIPEGYFAIKHGLHEHTRAEYVRAYDASASDVRQREEILEQIDQVVDMDYVMDRIGGNPIE